MKTTNNYMQTQQALKDLYKEVEDLLEHTTTTMDHILEEVEKYDVWTTIDEVLNANGYNELEDADMAEDNEVIDTFHRLVHMANYMSGLSRKVYLARSAMYAVQDVHNSDGWCAMGRPE